MKSKFMTQPSLYSESQTLKVGKKVQCRTLAVPKTAYVHMSMKKDYLEDSKLNATTARHTKNSETYSYNPLSTLLESNHHPYFLKTASPNCDAGLLRGDLHSPCKCQ